MNETDDGNIFNVLIDLKNFHYKLNLFIANLKKILSYNPEDTFNSNPVSEGKKPFELFVAEHGSFFLDGKQVLKISTGNRNGDVLAMLCKHKSYFAPDKKILGGYGNPDEKVSKIMYDIKSGLNRQGISMKYQRTNDGYEITQCYWNK